MNKRDDFSQKTIDTLCERVGGKCSNPKCRRETKDPHSDPQKRISLGEAAHITAAAEGGPRYNPDLTPEERSSIENGIWLCRSCARMIDSDESIYTVELLKSWKYAAEYEQFCIINQMDNWLKTNAVFENRKNIACRKAKEALWCDCIRNFWMEKQRITSRGFLKKREFGTGMVVRSGRLQP